MDVILARKRPRAACLILGSGLYSRFLEKMNKISHNVTQPGKVVLAQPSTVRPQNWPILLPPPLLTVRMSFMGGRFDVCNVSSWVLYSPLKENGVRDTPFSLGGNMGFPIPCPDYTREP